MKKFLCFIAAVCVFLSMGLTAFADITAANNGTGCSLGGPVTRETQRFVRYNFSQATSPEDLALMICDFAYENFTYDKGAISIPQTANTNRFIFEKQFVGVCLDYAAFTRTVFNIICRDKGWDHVGCHVALGNDLKRDGHAVNYISVEQPDGSVVIYEFDVTRDLTRFQKNKEPYELRFFFIAKNSREVRNTIMSAFRTIYKYPLRALV